MRKISRLATILITSFVMALTGLVASPIASASENGNGSISATFPLGSSVLSNAQKAAIRKALASSGSDVSFTVTGTAGKLPGVSDRWVQRLAKKRAQAIKAYIVSLGVSKENVTTQTKTTEIGIVPKSTGSYPTPAATPTSTVTATSTTTTTPTAPTTCATGATCIVGDRGPGGGIVFYVSAASFASPGSACSPACKYLEVAPATWQDTETTIDPIYTTVADDGPIYEWSSNTTGVTGQVLSAASPAESGLITDGGNSTQVVTEKENWKIGKGFNNTSRLTASSAKTAVLAYAGTSTAGQWFIPSVNELNELCKYVWGQTTGVLTAPCVISGTFKDTASAGSDLGGFVMNSYWSSSEYIADQAVFKNFSGGYQRVADKDRSVFIRPIRAF